jgi:putative alpha-1,2-mannosidase
VQRLTPPVRRRLGASVIAATTLAGVLLIPALSQAATAQNAGSAAAVTDPAALVDPMVGTGSGNSVVGQVDTFPGADVPFGMIQWSPDTPSRPDGGGYNYADSDITGFSLTHFSGPGCAIAGDFPILPLAGAVPADPGDAEAAFSHATEVAHPGSYAVTAGGIRTRLAVTDRTGVASFRYPATTSAQLLVKVADSANGGSAATFRVVGDDEIVGAVTSGGFCGQPDTYTVYFAARFNHPFTTSGTWGGTTQARVARSPGSTAVTVKGKQDPLRKQYSAGSSTQGSGVVAGGWVTFNTTRDPVIGMKTAISYVSVNGALGNLAAEARTWNVGAVAARATAAWNHQL